MSEQSFRNSCFLFPLEVIDYVQKKFQELESPNKLNVYIGHGAKAWVSDFNHPHYMAGRKAMKTGENAEERRLVLERTGPLNLHIMSRGVHTLKLSGFKASPTLFLWGSCCKSPTGTASQMHAGTSCSYGSIPGVIISVVLVLFCSVFGVEPDLTREGGSIPVTLTFQEATGRNVMLLPLGSSDDGAHSQNEKINRLDSPPCP